MQKSKEALKSFLQVIEGVDEFSFLNPDKVVDTQGKVDGYQHIFHLLKSAIEFYLLNNPLRPDWKLLSDGYHKILGDNVDAVYYFTQLRADQEYIVSGRRYDSCYLSFSVYGGEPTGEIVDRVMLNINHNDMTFDEEGNFSIKLTPNPQGPNEFKLESDAVNMFSREYFFDRQNSRESDLRIENITPQDKPTPLNDEQLADRISKMATFFEQTTWIAPLPVDFPLNDFLAPFPFEADQGGWGTIDNVYCFGRFRLEEHEYLKITFSSPACCYWGVQTWNFLMQSTNYHEYPVCINKKSAIVNDDGTYTIHVSHKPMDHNWISTAGYNEAIIFCRWLLSEEMPEQPTVSLRTH
jgi:hypothetical protein